MCLVQIGSGSASLDTNIQDGFSNFIKKKKIDKRIFIVEANSLHLENLKRFIKMIKMLKFIILQLYQIIWIKKKWIFFIV